MAKLHPVHALRADLEAARLRMVEGLAAAGGAISSDAFQELATLQTALTAVREELEAHGAKLGWGGDSDLD